MCPSSAPSRWPSSLLDSCPLALSWDSRREKASSGTGDLRFLSVFPYPSGPPGNCVSLLLSRLGPTMGFHGF